MFSGGFFGRLMGGIEPLYNVSTDSNFWMYCLGGLPCGWGGI